MILWSFYRSHSEIALPTSDMTRKFFTEVSRRAIRPTPKDEYAAFGLWVTRGAPRLMNPHGGLGEGFFGWTDSEDEEESNEEDNGSFDQVTE